MFLVGIMRELELWWILLTEDTKMWWKTFTGQSFVRYFLDSVSLGHVRPGLDCKFREKVVDDALPAFPVQHHMDWWLSIPVDIRQVAACGALQQVQFEEWDVSLFLLRLQWFALVTPQRSVNVFFYLCVLL